MHSNHYHTIIVGAGAIGSAAAYHLAKLQKRTLVLEQFELGHQLGSSHGAARITRHAYRNPHYAAQMPDAYRLWRELEAAAGEGLFLRTGGLTVGPPDEIVDIGRNLTELRIPYTVLDPASSMSRYPQFRVPENCNALFEPDAGALRAQRILEVERLLAVQSGAVEFRERCAVTHLELDGAQPGVVTNDGRFTAERLIVAAGPWATALVPDYRDRLSVTRQEVLYFNLPDAAAHDFAPGRFPVFIYHVDNERYYGMPTVFGTGVKVAHHGGPVVDPDTVARARSSDYEPFIRRFLERYIPALSGAPLASVDVCLYTSTEDERFLVMTLPGRDDVLFASPCSGHGFKLSILTGLQLAQWAIDDPLPNSVAAA